MNRRKFLEMLGLVGAASIAAIVGPLITSETEDVEVEIQEEEPLEDPYYSESGYPFMSYFSESPCYRIRKL